MIRRFYAEKKPLCDREAETLLREIVSVLKISSVRSVRILYRYDIEGDDAFPAAELLSDSTTLLQVHADLSGARVFAAQPLDGEGAAALSRFRDLVGSGNAEGVRFAKLFALYGEISEEELSAVKNYVFLGRNMREASLSLLTPPEKEDPVSAFGTDPLGGFRDLDVGGLEKLKKELTLDMGATELVCVQEYFKSEYRDPTETELRFFDAFYRYDFFARSSPIAGRREGLLGRAEASCTLAQRTHGDERPLSLQTLADLPGRLAEGRAAKRTDGGEEGKYHFLSQTQPLFSSPFGAVKVFAAGETGEDISLKKARELLAEREGKRLFEAGIAMGEVAVFCGGKHDRNFDLYLSNEVEESAAAAVPGDKIVLFGEDDLGATLGRLLREERDAGVIKGASRLWKGVAVTASELADGVDLDVDAVLTFYKKDAAISLFAAQTGAAVLTSSREAEALLGRALKAGIPAAVVATVTEIPRIALRISGKIAASISHAFLQSGGAGRSLVIHAEEPTLPERTLPTDFAAGMRALAGEKRFRLQRSLSAKYDFSVGGHALLSPFGGKTSATPLQASVFRTGGGEALYLAQSGGFREGIPFHAAYFAAVESVTKLIAAGADLEDIRLYTRAYLSRDNALPEAMYAAALGACKAAIDLGIFSESHMQPLFEEGEGSAFLSVAAAEGAEKDVSSPEFKGASHRVVLLAPACDGDGLPVPHSLIKNCKIVTALMRADKVLAAYALGSGGVAEGVLKCCLGNEIGFRFSDMVSMESVFSPKYGAFILELNDETEVGEEIGRTTLAETVARGLDLVPLVVLKELSDDGTSSAEADRKVVEGETENVTNFKKNHYSSTVCIQKPHVLLPVFRGMNGAEDTARAFEKAGAEVERFPLTAHGIEETKRARSLLGARIRESNILYFADGIEGDHVCGLSKFIAKFMQDEEVFSAISELLSGREGLVGGEGVGMGVLLRLGLLPGGAPATPEEDAPKFVSGESFCRIASVRVSSADSPWLAGVNAGDVFRIPVCGAGRLVCPSNVAKKLSENGQVMTQFVDREGNAAQIFEGRAANPLAIEGLLSPDGKVFGRLGRSSVSFGGLYRNAQGAFNMKLFDSAVRYFRR